MTSRKTIESQIGRLGRGRVRILLCVVLKRHQAAEKKICTPQMQQVFTAAIDLFNDETELNDSSLEALTERLKQTDEYKDPDPSGQPKRLAHGLCILCAYCLSVFQGRYLKKEVLYFIEPMVQVGVMLDSIANPAKKKTATLRRSGEMRSMGKMQTEQISFLEEYTERLLDNDMQIETVLKGRVPTLRI